MGNTMKIGSKNTVFYPFFMIYPILVILIMCEHGHFGNSDFKSVRFLAISA